MKKNTSIAVFTAALFLMVAVLVSCQDSLSYETSSLSVMIEENEIGKTLMPSETLTEIFKYSLEGTGPGSAVFGPIISTSNTISVTNLTTGTWSITATALNAENNPLACGTQNVELKSGLNDITVCLDEIPGSGSVKVNVTWDDGITSDSTFKVSVSVEDKLGTKLTNHKNVNVSEGMTSFIFPLAAGSHIVTVVASDSNGTIACGATEAVRIIDGTVTEGTIELKTNKKTSSDPGTAETGDGGFVITNNTGMPMSFYLDYISKNAVAGDQIALYAYRSGSSGSLSDNNLTFQWYIDGVLQATSNKRVFTTMAEAGFHRFDVVVRSEVEGTLCSATLQVNFGI